MRAISTRLDVIYEARFGRASLDFATSPGQLLKALHGSLTTRWAVNSEDVTLTPSQRLSEVRLKLSLFAGQATFEVDADKIGAHFRNAKIKDVPTIRDCLKVAFDAITNVLKGDRLADHSLKAMMFLTLLDDPKDNRAFLEKLAATPLQRAILEKIGVAEAQYYPAVKFEIEHPTKKWHFLFDLNRAYQSSEAIFLSSTLVCLDGSAIATIDERVGFLEECIVSSLGGFGIELIQE